jgi:beta-lactam-binding protein with PASTA domain/tRNA A-37 threonylcarbamoyl transferase component Bud32
MTAARTFGGRYEVLERVGAGGMAEVYRARDELLGRDVAVKVLSERFARDLSFVERFRREAQSAANLNHPNIVSLYDYGSDNGTYFIVMEYIDGRPLDDIIRREGVLLPERAAEIASDIAEALHKAHGGGLVHRDIKPSNVMITSGGQTKVTDFGIARAVASDGEQTVTQTGMVIGTASYLSPEQAQGNPVDARSDVYSLGCVLYEMLTGSPPFQGESPLAIAYKHVREDPPPPSHANPDVPAALDAIVMKALAKNPENRFSSALEMKHDLDRYLGGQQVHATPLLVEDTADIPRADRTSVMTTGTYEEPRRRRSVWPWLLGLLLLALLGAAIWLALAEMRPTAPQVRVPNVVGRDFSEAIAILNRRGLDPAVTRRPNERDEGTVFRQDPPAQERVDEGATVTLFVSSGPRETVVPDVVGRTKREAQQLLREAKLRLGTTTKTPSDTFGEGVILDQSPDAEVEVPEGSTIDITVSTGPEVTDVPFVEGLPVEQAVEAIENADLEANTRDVPSDDVEAGIVVEQDPAGGSEAEPGDVVDISVSTGPEATPLPDLTGQPAGAAEAELERLGLQVDQDTETGECLQPPNTVCSMDPEPGTEVEEGDRVTLFVQETGGDGGEGED